jgi:hypothetical protein
METISSGQSPQEEQLKIFETPADTFEYELLVGHEITDGSFKTSEQLRTQYVRLTDNIVQEVLEGVEMADPETGETTKSPVDFIVWLDKSARPLSWLIKDLWPTLAADKDGIVPPMPESKFVNIDRNQWATELDPQGAGRVDVDSIDPSIIRSLRSIFLSNPMDRAKGLVPDIDNAPTQFDGKTVLIIDEVRSSGRTLDYAEQFFKRAFPDANIAGSYWMDEMVTRNGAVGNADIPVWYSDADNTGRGIGNRNIDLSRKSKNSTQRLGAWFLSTSLRTNDPKTVQLRKEFHQLAQDVNEGKVLVEPSRERTDEDYDERAIRLNKLDSFDEYLAKLKELKNS